MGWFRTALGLVRRAVREPRSAVLAARSRWWTAGLGALERVPTGVRRAVLLPVVRIAMLALRTRGDHAIAAPVAMVALVESGHPDEALALALDVGDEASQRTTERLARIAMFMGRPDVADRLLAHLSPDAVERRAGSAELRGTVDVELGRLTAALEHLETAASLDPRRVGARAKATRIRGQLALMDPAWRPARLPLRPLPAGTRRRGRVLHLLSISLPHVQIGYTVRTQNVARCQQAAGLDPRMVTRAGFPGNRGVRTVAGSDQVEGVEYQRVRPVLDRGLPIDRVADETARGLADIISDLRPAALQPATDYFQGQVALALGECLDLPVVYEVRGFLEETWRSRHGAGAEASDRYRLAHAAETSCMRRASAVVTLSSTMRSEILARGGIDPDRVVVIPNAVDVEWFVPGPRDVALASTLGIEQGDTVVGYVSTFNPYEGIHHLLKAVARLHRQQRPVRLLLVGDGDERARLEAEAARLGLLANGVAIFTGRVPHAEIKRYYRTIDIFVVPRTNDRVSQLVTPLKPYEAMAMEKAVVVSGVDALLEIVHDGETGRTFQADDPSALSDVIAALMDDPDQRRRLGIAAREWVATNRSWTQNGQRYRELFERLGAA